ncbi:MAG: bifunctional phosphopantothenoylcysteine decarboxylase/phosphopantothenate--cysteine ligase CoaBC [Geminicoccales bacterium]
MLSKRILLIIAGGIAAYKTLDVIRRLRERDVDVRCILTKAGSAFVTPLSIAGLSGNKVYTDLFSLTDEAEMGHIRLSRDADLVVIAPATADLMAKMANGLADDLASTALLATDKPVLVVPAMNPEMWQHPATQRNIQQLQQDDILFIGPNEGEMACGETGRGRMAEPNEIVQAIMAAFDPVTLPLKGIKALVTSGPTYEAIDPVRFIGNRSSGKQGHAIARALRRAGAEVTLVSGPVDEPTPANVEIHHIESAREMLQSCKEALPIDVAVCVAAVADWRPANQLDQKIKKKVGEEAPSLALVENPDILKTLSKPGSRRPKLVIGFAAETENVDDNARRKLASKGCDWILANNVGLEQATFGSVNNTILLFDDRGNCESWPEMTKDDVAERLVAKIALHLKAACIEEPTV